MLLRSLGWLPIAFGASPFRYLQVARRHIAARTVVKRLVKHLQGLWGRWTGFDRKREWS